MIIVKTPEQIKLMRIAGRITGEAILAGAELIKPGVSTKAIDDRIRHYIEKCGAKPSFLGYGGFPGSACISVNNQVIHGIPSQHVYLEEGDIVKLDVGAYIHGFHGDSANTFPVGKISEEAARLIEVTRESFFRGVEAAGKEGERIGEQRGIQKTEAKMGQLMQKLLSMKRYEDAEKASTDAAYREELYREFQLV